MNIASLTQVRTSLPRAVLTLALLPFWLLAGYYPATLGVATAISLVLLGIGWAPLLSSPAPRFSQFYLLVSGLVLMLGAYFGSAHMLMRAMGGLTLLAFGLEMLRPLPRQNLVESLGINLSGMIFQAAGVMWIIARLHRSSHYAFLAIFVAASLLIATLVMLLLLTFRGSTLLVLLPNLLCGVIAKLCYARLSYPEGLALGLLPAVTVLIGFYWFKPRPVRSLSMIELAGASVAPILLTGLPVALVSFLLG